MHPFTRLIHDEHDEQHFGAVTHPIYQNSLFTFASYEDLEQAFTSLQDHYVYMRGKNPTVRQLERKCAELDGGEEALAFASGMGAITAGLFSFLKQGDHVICVQDVYPPVKDWLDRVMSKFGVSTSYVEGGDLEQWRSSIQTNTRLMYLESPSSFKFRLQDLHEITRLAKERSILTMIDNTWATPIFQQPIACGVDIVAYSLSKYAGGHSDLVGGALVGSREHLTQVFQTAYMLHGAIMTPSTASLVMRGLRTYPLRMEQHRKSGLQIAEWLVGQPFIMEVNHPGLSIHPQHELGRKQMTGTSGLFSIKVKQPLSEMRKWLNGLRLFRIGISWGGYESLAVLRPGESEQVTYARFSIGLEDSLDLIADLRQACPWQMK
jgi:cystathionine beta-lyase/cystathionine gamma-synthase